MNEPAADLGLYREARMVQERTGKTPLGLIEEIARLNNQLAETNATMAEAAAIFLEHKALIEQLQGDFALISAYLAEQGGRDNAA